jgi:uncharacterized protein (DUF427 family)
MSISRERPGPGQESVWDYPRPPRVEQSTEEIVVRLGGEVILRTTAAVRVLETSHPPVYYLPLADFAAGALEPVDGTSFCEFKGSAAYFDVVGGGRRAPRGAWTYPRPSAGYEELAGRAAVYPGAMDSCTVDGEEVAAQEGGFYGGWVTRRITGPFKGAPGTRGW